MGASDIIEIENAVTLFATGNQMRVRGDMVRRTCQRRLNIPQKWRLGIPHFVALGVRC